MERRLTCFCLLVIFTGDAFGFQIRNKLLTKCLEVSDAAYGGRVSLGECDPDSSLQEWRWLEDSQALSSRHTGQCLTAPREQYEGVYLQDCVLTSRPHQASDEAETQDVREANSQMWTCSKKGHLTLVSRGLHLNAAQQSTLVFLSREHKQGSRWQTLDDNPLCDRKENKLSHKHHHQTVEVLKPPTSSSYVSVMQREAESAEVAMSVNLTELNSDLNTSSLTEKSAPDQSEMFYNMVYGMAWKITMLVLSSLALLVGVAVLIVSIFFNRRKKVVCVLRSYTPRSASCGDASPRPSDRALLTEHAACLPSSSPTVQRGEVLIEWKDGTVTPLYEA